MADVSPNFEKIRSFWSNAARHDQDADGLRPTARDPHLQAAVEAAIAERLRPGSRVLDIGCGDGQSTLAFAPRVGEIVGIDYIDAYVERARNAGAGHAGVSFDQANVLDLSAVRARFDRFDTVITIRCLINLDTWQNQCRAIREIAETVEPNGLYLASEGWSDGIEGLNLWRGRFGLPPIAVAQYNLTIDRTAFEREVSRDFDIVGYHSLGLYLYLSRVLHPVMVAPEPPRHDHAINAAAATLQIGSVGEDRFRDCDYAGVYVLRRK